MSYSAAWVYRAKSIEIACLLKTTLQQGESITIFGFGTFKVRNKLPRKAWNFITGESLIITARRVVTFRSSTSLRAEVNAARTEALRWVT